jgi:uncharacterized membrane protein YfcA
MPAALAVVAVASGAAVQSATGFGFALFASPALFAVLEPYEAVTALLALGLALNLLVLADGGVGAVRWRALAPLLAGALPGLAIGAVALAELSKPALQIGVGLAVIAAVAVQARARSRGRRRAHDSGHWVASGLGAGLASGALTTSISVSGPPLVLWLEERRLSPGELRASLAVAFLVLNVIGGSVLLVAAAVDPDAGDPAGLGTIVPLIALVVVGHIAGAALFRRLDHRRFGQIVLALVALAGVASVVAGVAGL